MKDARYGVMAQLLGNMYCILKIVVFNEPQLLAVHRGDDVCYVETDKRFDMNGKIALLSFGKLRNDIERCLSGSEKYMVWNNG